MDVDKRIDYMQQIFRGKALKKYKNALKGYKQQEKGIAGNQWTLVVTKDITIKQFWT